jgi:hypothetical protein
MLVGLSVISEKKFDNKPDIENVLNVLELNPRRIMKYAI